MATSQNGGTVVDYGDKSLITTIIPGTDAKYVGGIKGVDLNVIAMYIGHRWNTEIERVVAYGTWGHNVRTIRGQTTGYSNHAAGEAGDINAPQHPLGTQTLGSAKLAKLRAIASDLIGVIRFGAFYSGRKDEMHWERIGTYGQVTALANRIRRGEMPNVPTELLDRRPDVVLVPSPSIPTAPPMELPSDVIAWPPAPYKLGQVIEDSDKPNEGIKALQRRLNEHIRFVGGKAMEVDGDFGPTTLMWVRWFQAARGLKVDGKVGLTTWSSLWK